MKLWVFCCKTLKDKTIKKFLLPHKDYQDWLRLIETLKYFLLTQSLVFPSYQGDSTICHKGNFLKFKGVVLPHPPVRHSYYVPTQILDNSFHINFAVNIVCCVIYSILIDDDLEIRLMPQLALMIVTYYTSL